MDLKLLHPQAASNRYTKGPLCEDIILLTGKAQKLAKALEKTMMGETHEKKAVPNLLKAIDDVYTKFDDIKSFCNKFFSTDGQNKRGRKRKCEAAASG